MLFFVRDSPVEKQPSTEKKPSFWFKSDDFDTLSKMYSSCFYLVSPGLSDPPFTGNRTPFMPIALGVIASAGFILLISLGLMYFNGMLCCFKQKKGML